VAFSKKQRLFIEHYLQCWNASEAARRAGYSERSSGSIGHENLNKPEIAAEIKRRIDEAAMGADEVLHRLAEQARAQYSDYFRVYKDDDDHQYVGVDIEALKEDGKGHLIKKLRYDTDGRLIVEFYDAQAALVQVGRHFGLFTDNVDVTSAGQPIKTYYAVSPDDWETDEGDNDDRSGESA